MRIEDLVSIMIRYQEMHDIKSQCLTNTQTLYDLLKNSSYTHVSPPDVKSAACIAVGWKNNGEMMTTKNHMILKVDNRIIDPSYEVSSLDNILYYDTYDRYKDDYSGRPPFDKDDLDLFHNFTEYAKKINEGKFWPSPDLGYYKNQIDYIQQMCKQQMMNT